MFCQLNARMASGCDAELLNDIPKDNYVTEYFVLEERINKHVQH